MMTTELNLSLRPPKSIISLRLLSFQEKSAKIWSEITSIRDRFDFLEKPKEDDAKNVDLINTLQQRNQDLCQEICILKQRLFEETSNLSKISEERDSYKTALQIMTKELNPGLNMSSSNQREADFIEASKRPSPRT